MKNVTIIPPKDKAFTKSYNKAIFSKDLDDHEYRVFMQISASTLYGFKAEKMSFLSGSGRPAMENALNRLIARGIVLRQAYYAYDSGIEGVGRPRTVYYYTVNNEEVERLDAIKHKEPEQDTLLVPVEFSHLNKASESRKKHPKAVPSENQPSQSTDALRPLLNPLGQPYIVHGTKPVKVAGKIHDCHLQFEPIILASDGYEPEHKEKLQPFLDKLAKDGTVIADLETFVQRFNDYITVCEENADKWDLLNGARIIFSKNEKTINGLLRSLREPFNTVTFEEYERRFFALMNEQHRITDNKSVIYVNRLRELHNKGELEKYFNLLHKKPPHSKK